MLKFSCTNCRYIYNPYIGDIEQEIEPLTDFYDIKDDWTCPVCGDSKDSFIEFIPVINEVHKIEDMTPGEIKHTPFYVKNGDKIIVRLGDDENIHPTEETHFIEYVGLFDENLDEIEIIPLPDLEEEIEFDISGLDFFEVRASCNLHGIWKGVEVEEF